jgi:uncharacterized membrane protein
MASKNAPLWVIALLIVLSFLTLMYKDDTVVYQYDAPTIMETQMTEDIPTREEVIAERKAAAELKEKNYLKDLDNRVEVQTQKTAEAVEDDMDR